MLHLIMKPVRSRVVRGNLIIGTIVVALAMGIGAFIINQSVSSQGSTLESQIRAHYMLAQEELSACVSKSEAVAGIASEQSESFEHLMEEIIKGRYNVQIDERLGADELFVQVTEDFPELSEHSKPFERVHETVVGCRDDFSARQAQLISALTTYDTWRTGSWFVRTFGGEFPSDNLRLPDPDDRNKSVQGWEAHDVAWRIVLHEDAVKAYEDGVLPDADVTINSD